MPVGTTPRRRAAWRAAALLLGLALSAPAVAHAQPRVSVTLAPDSVAGGAREPVVRLRDLLAEPRWLSALESGLPLRLHFELQRWRVRGSWFDDLDAAVAWDILVRRDPLRQEFLMETTLGGRRTVRRYPTSAALAIALDYAYLVRFAPLEPGRYYYQVIATVSTLSDSDVAELDRFLRGDLGEAAGDGNVGDAMTRGARRLLLRIAGLPSLRLDARSGETERR